ncbi:hypothetical protein EV03_0502 [Prochlorococcus marinus str. PAC1]|uniref:Uncharacterized protein n=1 Tax=Prochlorococcus marinus str. PAC1 TaxID=59924 RepID=A0A0A2C881_PROMR|nr:hypothetical protein EV03_0502 [Prochlorococcus marinus str. PAC1]
MMLDLRKNHLALFWQPKTTKQKLKGHKQKVKNCSTFAKMINQKTECINSD